MTDHQALVFECQGQHLIGVAEIPADSRRTAVVVVTGGPQYRVGSHRQFTLLCRELARHGFPSMRFDFRGSGDSYGQRAAFTDLQPDITAAVDKLVATVPDVSQIVLLGLCDGASAALICAHKDRRVAGVVMLNPWVRTTGSLEQARVRGYYPGRLTSLSFWKRLLTGKVNVIKSLQSFREQLAVASASEDLPHESSRQDFVQDMLAGAHQFKGELLVILSGSDMTAQEYRDLLAGSDTWREQMSADNVQQVEIADANHTFARAVWRDAVAGHCLDFVRRLDAGLTDQH